MSSSKLASLPATELRHLIRACKYTGDTAGLCANKIQYNVVLLEASFANRFKLFCESNPVPCPCHYVSAPNEVSAGPLCPDSDVRTDVSKYRVLENGEHTSTVSTLMDGDVRDHVTFYLGCSYTFEHALINSGIPQRHMQHNNSVAMYISNIQCVSVPPFECNMVVSMRYIPFEFLRLAHEVSASFPLSHGAPIWIGNPARIGIRELSVPDFGEYSAPSEGDVPVFWGCGVTTQQALVSAKLGRVFTHYPGHMFISDVEAKPELITPIEIVALREPPDVFVSFLSKRACDVINSLETVISQDLNNRGIRNLIVKGDLLKSCLYLSHCDTVAIISEFPCNYEFDVPYETDGIPGVFAAAKVLSYLGKKITLLHSGEQMRNILHKCMDLFAWSKAGNTIELKSLASIEALMASSDSNRALFDCLLTIEHSGPARDGNFYTMHGNDISQYCTRIATVVNGIKLFDRTVSVGDGGNEWGMGKVMGNVTKHVDKGGLIASADSADFLVSAGVSNWGGYAIAAGVLEARNCEVHRRYAMHGIGYQSWKHTEGILFSKTEQRDLLTVMCELGIRDGISKELGLRVDGLDIGVHDNVIDQIAKCLLHNDNI